MNRRNTNKQGSCGGTPRKDGSGNGKGGSGNGSGNKNTPRQPKRK